MVLVAMSNHDRAQVGEALLDVGHIGDDQVDPALLLFRELAAAIEQDDVPPVLDERHVLADLSDAAKGNDPQPAGRRVVRRRPLAGARPRSLGLAGRGRLIAGAGVDARPAWPAWRWSGP